MVHLRRALGSRIPVCGNGGGNRATRPHTTDAVGSVTCAHCLRSIAKRDREFRRKARERFRPAASYVRAPQHAPRAYIYGDRSRRVVTMCGASPDPRTQSADTVTCGACIAARAISAEESR